MLFEGLFPSLLITFRESLEAVLIVVIMISYLSRMGKGELNRYVYIGAGGAVVASFVLGLFIQRIYGELEGVSVQFFEGFGSLVAVVVLTYMIFWMTEHSKKIRGELQERIEVSVTTGELFGISILAFAAVFREGLETVLFLTATFFLDPLGVIVGIVLGSAIVLLIATLLMKGTYRLDISKFFKYTSVLLIIFAAGLAGYGTHELIEAGEGLGVDFGVLSQHAYDINPPINPDGSYPLLHERGIIGSILKALAGYDGNPEWLRVIVYVGYCLTVGTYILKTYKKSE